MNRWEDKTKHDPGWDSRTRMLADLILPGDIILEFGAGRQSLKNMIDKTCLYNALDLPDFDLNNTIWVELPKHTCAVFGGVLEYVDIEHVISKMTAKHIVLSYSTRKNNETIEQRINNFWVSHFSYTDIIDVLFKFQYKLNSDVRWWGGTQMVAKFTK